jgi:hypothetical protein
MVLSFVICFLLPVQGVGSPFDLCKNSNVSEKESPRVYVCVCARALNWVLTANGARATVRCALLRSVMPPCCWGVSISLLSPPSLTQPQ